MKSQSGIYRTNVESENQYYNQTTENDIMKFNSNNSIHVSPRAVPHDYWSSSVHEVLA